MLPETISKQVARRYVLGRQGLWPGRRWRGRSGVAEAIRRIEAVQIDPINVFARNHDIVLWSRVLDYDPGDLDALLYQERAFFDYGGTLFLYPMAELPYWRTVMQRRAKDGRWAAFAATSPEVLARVKDELRARGPLGSRDFAAQSEASRVTNYRSGKDTGVALYYLWLTGELMTHRRRGFDRIFDFRENVAPADVQHEASEEESDAFFARKALSFRGLGTPREWSGWFSGFMERRVSREEALERLEGLVASGAAATVRVEGRKEMCYFLASDAAALAVLNEGRVPDGWRALETTTEEEVTFLAPLDIVSARGRAKVLFDFEYIWEVYKPAHQRRWGYYTLPILYGDQLVARLDPKLDRKSGTLAINGFWLEDDALAEDEGLAAALARGLGRFTRFLEARNLDLSALQSPALRTLVRTIQTFPITGQS
jgi:uncharacterized protein YcaQ